MKHSFLAALLVLALSIVAATPALAAGAASPPASEAEPVPEAAPAVEAASAADAACSAPDPATVLGLTVGSAWHCPFGAPRCFKDDHCDAYCGDPRFGVCGSNNCCLCSG